jgi:hypothetical protein
VYGAEKMKLTLEELCQFLMKEKKLEELGFQTARTAGHGQGN